MKPLFRKRNTLSKCTPSGKQSRDRNSFWQSPEFKGFCAAVICSCSKKVLLSWFVCFIDSKISNACCQKRHLLTNKGQFFFSPACNLSLIQTVPYILALLSRLILFLFSNTYHMNIITSVLTAVF